ncbi:MAG: DNA polymerase IV [Tractidigestivibacter sp.]|jgi:DNA polymerase-4|uniref:DNA polymerase IV n=1 Tax=Tractidigestivibacter sp. TaxID=2847320 RepID=UPI003D89DCAA
METRSDIIAWNGPAVGLLDLDAFFASVEQLDHPEWRGKPVIVGGSPEKRGVVSTASYEARVYGVHSAMASATAKRLCPDAIWASPNFKRYREMSDKVMSIIKDETPRVEQVSIDEAFFDVTPGRFSRESPVDICQRIQRRVLGLGISCSIGIGVNKTVAKIASEREKPRGLTVVFPGTEAGFLAPLPVSAMSGIGPAATSKLAEMGIKTLGQLAHADEKELEVRFGVMGPRMRERAAGREKSVVQLSDAEEEVKSVSNERTFETDITGRDELEAAILHIAGMVGRRLRKKGLKGRTVTLKLRYDTLRSRTAQTRLDSRVDDEHVFGPVAVGLLDELWKPGIRVRLVGVGISSFDDDPAGEQLRLFPDGQASENERSRNHANLSRVTDALKERFGDDAVEYGRDLRFRSKTTGTAPKDLPKD